MERLQGSLRARLKELSGKGTALHPDLIFHWALQIARVFAHVHARHVLQVDVGCHNVLLDCDENLRLVDFAGSSIDGSEPMILPTIPLPSVAAEIFALGTLFYELETTHLPYHDKINGEQLFQSAVFPELGGLLLSRIISNCWQLRFLCMEDVIKSLHALQSSHSAHNIMPWWKRKISRITCAGVNLHSSLV